MIGAIGGSIVSTSMWIISSYLLNANINPNSAQSDLSGGGYAAIVFFFA